MKNWPFPGDAPVSRARKMALAYRALAQQQQEAREQILRVLEQLDRRLIAFDNPGAVAIIDKAMGELAGDGVKELDERFTQWGETFHAEQPDHYEPDDYVKAKVAAQLINCAPKTISNLRIHGRLPGVWDPNIGSSGGYWYKVSDVYETSSKMRSRSWRRKSPQIPSTTTGEVTPDDPQGEPR